MSSGIMHGSDRHTHLSSECTKAICRQLSIVPALPVETATEITTMAAEANLADGDLVKIVDSINGNTDVGGTEVMRGTVSTRMQADFDGFENYFTASEWGNLRQLELMPRTVVKKLIDLRCLHLKEPALAGVVATGLWACGQDLQNALYVRDQIKAELHARRKLMPRPAEMVRHYPASPLQLQAQYPAVFHAAFPGAMPQPPPDDLDIESLQFMLLGAPCRVTKLGFGRIAPSAAHGTIAQSAFQGGLRSLSPLVQHQMLMQQQSMLPGLRIFPSALRNRQPLQQAHGLPALGNGVPALGLPGLAALDNGVPLPPVAQALGNCVDLPPVGSEAALPVHQAAPATPIAPVAPTAPIAGACEDGESCDAMLAHLRAAVGKGKGGKKKAEAKAKVGAKTKKVAVKAKKVSMKAKSKTKGSVKAMKEKKGTEKKEGPKVEAKAASKSVGKISLPKYPGKKKCLPIRYKGATIYSTDNPCARWRVKPEGSRLDKAFSMRKYDTEEEAWKEVVKYVKTITK